MNILVIGGGAREHAIIYKLSQSSRAGKIYAAPGNAGIAELAKCIDISATDVEGLVEFAKNNSIDLVIVGPEDPLCMGVVDRLTAEGIKVFGPEKASAQLEGSKAFAKEFMLRNDIPTARYIKTSDINQAMQAFEMMFTSSPYGKAVIKADGLCAGKGVVVAESLEQGFEFITEVLTNKIFGETELVLEEYIEGIEASLLCFVDHNTIVAMPTAKDHKRIYEAERGPNTGGMGTYSPNPIALAYHDEMIKEVAQAYHKGLQKEGLSYRGIIFFGFMITPEGIKVLEFNTRFGDPETQSILVRLETDLLEIFDMATQDKLNELDIKWSDDQAVTLVLASKGYPGAYEKGKPITIKDKAKLDSLGVVFHAGTKLDGNTAVTNGGRVLSLTAKAPTLDEAMEKAYKMAELIDFEGKTYRKDIGPMVKRIYVQKKAEFDIEGASLAAQIKESLGIHLDSVSPYQRYDMQNITIDEINKISKTILSEPPVDDIYIQEEAFEVEKSMTSPIVVELHRGQYDQREDGLLQSLAVVLGKEDVKIRCARVYDIKGKVTAKELEKIKAYLINPVDQQEGSMKLPNLLEDEQPIIQTKAVIDGFIAMDESALSDFHAKNGLAMKLEDLKYFQDYFKTKENRDPSEVELAMVDTYWSDHCRHTTFNTVLENVSFISSANKAIQLAVLQAYKDYLDLREKAHNNEKPLTLMDMATIMARYMRKNGQLDDLEVSDEINACSVKIKVKVNGEDQDYLLMFKNETHNHPTEIEPFGGASTCLGGAIRDPLSGRSYVYQAMRVTGSADPREAISETLEGKLPQRKITQEAARGYSAYGNQIGLCTGFVDEVYHPGFKAKRMEVGAVIGAAPAGNVIRKQPKSGDIIVLIGGRTGRDGVGGATGSSKEQTEKSIELSSAEVQKGNAPSERKLQRLFRNPKAASLIKKCNDFGAGGVSVAIGELADGLDIKLDKVPLKYAGLTPKEIAISESQERMACVISPADLDAFMKLCHEENIEATVVATVTDTNRLVMTYNDEVMVDIDRTFLDSAGVTSSQEVEVEIPYTLDMFAETEIKDIEAELKSRLADLNVCSKKGLIQRFDNTIGAASVLIPLGGDYQLTPAQGMACNIPSLDGDTSTASVMTYGYNPYLSEQSPFHGAYYAVIESVSKIAALGAPVEKTRLSFQEYFEKLGEDKRKWGKPLSALIGALKVQRELSLPAIGGKDSMSGTYKDLNVPPTLISFAVSYQDSEKIISQELKEAGNTIGLLFTPATEDNLLDMEMYKDNLNTLKALALENKIKSAYAVTHEGILAGLTKMAFGNNLGVNLNADLKADMLFKPLYGSFVVELAEEDARVMTLGKVEKSPVLKVGASVNIELKDLQAAYEEPLESVFGTKNPAQETVKTVFEAQSKLELKPSKAKTSIAQPKVVIPVFPGTNCEYDSAFAFEKAGAKATIQVLRNLTLKDIDESLKELEKTIRESQILMIPGGFSLGDEPDGSGKFIAAVLSSPRISDAIAQLLEKNDGLILGVCNGFQALIKTGLLPYGEIKTLDSDAPTLTHNAIGRHMAQFIKTKVVATNSPWTSLLTEGDIHQIPVSHGEGRLIGSEAVIKQLYDNHQVAFQYVDDSGNPTMKLPYNPNGSYGAIEGLVSPCGRILGKMGHTERVQKGLFNNYKITSKQLLFEGGVTYYK